MKLDYSYRDCPMHWIDGPLPPHLNSDARIKVSLQGTTDGNFPMIHSIGDLLLYKSPNDQHAVTLLVEYTAGHNPPLTIRPPDAQFHPYPGAPIMGQIRVALTKEAIAAIQESGDPRVPYIFSLSEIEFHQIR